MSTPPVKLQRPRAPRPVLRATLYTFLTLVFLYALTAKGFTEITDAEAYYLLTQALVERGEVSLDPAERLSEKVAYSVGPAGRAYAQYWLGYPLFLAPWYAAGRVAQVVAQSVSPRLGALGRMVPRSAVNAAPILITAAQAALLVALVSLLGGGVRRGVAVAFLFGLATLAWPYSKIGFYEPFLGLCLLVSVYALAIWGYRSPGWWWPLLAGFAFGWGVATKPTAALAAPGLLVYALYLWRRPAPGRSGPRRSPGAALAGGLLGCLPWLGVILWYNWARTGDLLNPGYEAWNWQLSGETPLFWRLLVAYLVGPGRGLLLYSPVVLLAALGWPALWRRRPGEAWLVLLVFLAYYLFHAARVAPDSWGWGPRYLVPVVGLVMLPAAWALPRWWSRRGGRALVVVLAALGIAVQLLSITANYGAWFHEVHAQTGSSDAWALEWRWWPLAGQVHTLARIETAPLSLAGSGLQGGVISEEFKAHLRYSLDFWWYYAWRLGLAWPLWAGAGLLLALGAALSALGLRRAWRQSGEADPEEAAP